MESKKDHAIHKILKEFEEFADLTLMQLDLLEKQINTEDPEVCEENRKVMKKNEKKLDEFEVSISEKIISAIVLHQPVASDLRKIFACYRMSINLERIGDLVMNVLKLLEKLRGHEGYKRSSNLIDHMFAQSSQMVSRSLSSFINSDKDFAVWTIKNDDVIDEIYNKLMKKTIKKELSGDNRKLLLDFMDIRTIMSNIERIADHATNIAEATIYSLEGMDIRHKGIDEVNL